MPRTKALMSAYAPQDLVDAINCAGAIKGLRSVSAMATAVNMNRKHLAKRMKNPNEFTLSELVSICKGLGMPPVFVAEYIERVSK